MADPLTFRAFLDQAWWKNNRRAEPVVCFTVPDRDDKRTLLDLEDLMGKDLIVEVKPAPPRDPDAELAAVLGKGEK